MRSQIFTHCLHLGARRDLEGLNLAAAVVYPEEERP
jgi:hypothetical protein